jgi:hypothetical protein
MVWCLLSTNAYAVDLFDRSLGPWVPTVTQTPLQVSVGTAGTREVYFQVSGSYVVYDVGAELDMNGASASVEFEIWRASTGGAGVVLNSLVASTSAAFSGNGVTRRRVPLSATLTSGT